MQEFRRQHNQDAECRKEVKLRLSFHIQAPNKAEATALFGAKPKLQCFCSVVAVEF